MSGFWQAWILGFCVGVPVGYGFCCAVFGVCRWWLQLKEPCAAGWDPEHDVRKAELCQQAELIERLKELATRREKQWEELRDKRDERVFALAQQAEAHKAEVAKLRRGMRLEEGVDAFKAELDQYNKEIGMSMTREVPVAVSKLQILALELLRIVAQHKAEGDLRFIAGLEAAREIVEKAECDSATYQWIIEQLKNLK